GLHHRPLDPRALMLRDGATSQLVRSPGQPLVQRRQALARARRASLLPGSGLPGPSFHRCLLGTRHGRVSTTVPKSGLSQIETFCLQARQWTMALRAITASPIATPIVASTTTSRRVAWARIAAYSSRTTMLPAALHTAIVTPVSRSAPAIA